MIDVRALARSSVKLQGIPGIALVLLIISNA